MGVMTAAAAIIGRVLICVALLLLIKLIREKVKAKLIERRTR